MPAPTFTTHVDGTVMDWSAIAADFTTFRTWLNTGIVNADWADGSVRREHLVAPVIRGFPSTGLESTFQGILWREFGNQEADAGTALQWGSTVERLTVFPALLGKDNRWRTPMGATLFLPVDSDVEVNLQAALHVVQNTATVTYPTGAGVDATGANGGRYLITGFNRVTGAEVDFGESEYPVFPMNFATDYQANDSVRCVAHRRLTAGTWDIQFVYDIRDGSVVVWQHDLSRVTMKIEVH
jgi:hypothetical protein